MIIRPSFLMSPLIRCDPVYIFADFIDKPVPEGKIHKAKKNVYVQIMIVYRRRLASFFLSEDVNRLIGFLRSSFASSRIIEKIA